MARLQADLKAGYYPLSDEHLPLIASLFAPGVGKLLDPCAGEGVALTYLAEAWHLTPYANELNHERAQACRERCGPLQAVQGDLRELRTSHNAFGVIYCNPPYSQDTTADRADRRTELALMKASWKWLQPGGFMVWIIYDYHLARNPHALEFLALRSIQTGVYRLPGLHLNHYRQIVVVAQKRPNGQTAPDDLEPVIQALKSQAEDPPLLTLHTEPHYQLPPPPRTHQFRFVPARLTPDFALAAVQSSGVQHNNRFQSLIAPPPPETLERPITLPKAAQLLMLMVSGFTNGLVLTQPDGRQVMVRGTIQPVRTQTADEEVLAGDSGSVVGRKQTFITRPQSTVALLDADGRVALLDDEAAIVDFVETHREILFDYVKTHHAPLYTFDYAGLRSLLDGIRLPLQDEQTGLTELRPLYTTQRHIIAAAYTALQHRDRVLVAGEPGIGKTAMGAALAAAVGQERQPGQVTIVMAPPQLTQKWQREIERMHGLPARYTTILKRVDDVRAFMERAARCPDILHIGIISREMAKLSSGWQHALHWRRQHHALWPAGEDPPDILAGQARTTTTYLPCCPTCGAVALTKPGGDPYTPAYFGYDPQTRTYDRRRGSRSQHQCRACGGALYQVVRMNSSQPRPGEKYPRRNPRMALAEYIARVFQGRVALYLADEVHELKSIASDQGRAMTHLVNAADKSVGLTGTLYGGVASSLYLLLFMFSRHIRTQYPFGAGGLSTFINDMGVLEQVIEDRPQYANGVYTGTKRYERGAKESPGCSPRLVVETLPVAVFAGLQDIGLDMPALVEIPVAVQPDAPLSAAYQTGEAQLKNYLLGLRYEGKTWTFMGAYLQALMNYPDAAVHPYPVVHKEDDHLVWTFPGLGADRIAPKEQALLDIVREELAEGRNVAVFVRQSGKRDIQRRLASLIREQVPGANPTIIYGGNRSAAVVDDGIPSASVPTARREAAIQQVLEQGHNVLVCNPLLIQTGLDLLQFPSLVFFEILFSLYPVDQASRRHWRVIQRKECRTYYLYYQETMEQQALELLARKREAAQILYGDLSARGLAALTGEGGIANDLVKALEQAICQTSSDLTTPDEQVDLHDLFAQTSLAHYESPWTLAVAAEGVQHPAEIRPVVPEPELEPAPVLVPVETPQPNPLLPRRFPVAIPLPPRPSTRKRRTQSGAGMPEPVRPARRAREPVQLSLF